MDALSCSHTTGTDEQPLEDDVTVLMVADARYGIGETETNNSDQFDVIWIDETDKLNPGIPDVLHIADGTDNEKPLKTTDLVTAQAPDQYCQEVARDVEKRDRIYLRPP